MLNFLSLFDRLSHMPLPLLLQPLLRQLASATYELNLFDFHFFCRLAGHPQLPPAQALVIFEQFLNIFMEEKIWHGCAFQLLTVLLEIYSQEELIRTRMHNLVQEILRLHLKLRLIIDSSSSRRRRR